MILKHKSSAWILVGLQAVFSVFFLHYLSASIGISAMQVSDSPSFYGSLFTLQFGVTLLLLLTALWKYDLTAIVFLFVIHAVCPIIFFTDLTRNPYYTQIALFNIWVGFVWLTWMWESHQDGRFTFPKTPLNLPLLAFAAVATISWGASFLSHPQSFHASMIAEGLRNWLFLIVNGLGVYFIAVTLDEKWRHRFIWFTFYVGAAAAIYGLMQFYGVEKIWSKTLTPFGNRPVSTFGNPNFLSSYLLLLIPLLIVPIVTAKRAFTKVLSFVIFFIVLAGIIATMTRSTWVGTLAIFALLPLSPSFRQLIAKKKKVFLILGATLVLGLVAWPKSSQGGYANPWKRLIEIRQVKNKGGYQPLHQRVLIWCSSFQMVRDHVVIGKGWGLFELFYPHYQGRMMFNSVLKTYRTHANNCHNEILEIWSQTGSMGLGVYLWLWIVIIVFGFHFAKEFYPVSPEKSAWVWALASGSLGMFVDNFFGNVSIHFTIPAFLFWWQTGLLFGMPRSDQQSRTNPSEWATWRLTNHLHTILLCCAAGSVLSICVWNFRREFQEVYYFRGFKISKANNMLDLARQELEKGWKWFPREVNSNYEMANTLARLAQQSYSSGLGEQADAYKKKAIWGYHESLNSNAGYDEIYFNLAALQSQMGWMDNEYSEFTVPTPWGENAIFSGKTMPGAYFNYSRALAINPLSMDAYTFLGNSYLQNHAKYRTEGLLLFEQAVRFFPRNKEFWVNLGFLQIQQGENEKAYESIRQAMNIDPTYEFARRNLGLLLQRMNRPNDPLAQLLNDLPKISALIGSKNWRDLTSLAERLSGILPDNFQMRFVLANAYFEQRLYDQAERQYLEALRIEPDNSNALNNLAMALRAQGKTSEARVLYERLLDVSAFAELAKKSLESLPK